MKYLSIFLTLHLATCFFNPGHSQEFKSKKLPVFGSFSIGYGNTFFSGALSEKETINDSRGYGRNDGMTLSTFYYWAPSKLRGFGIGTGIKAFVARPNKGGESETYTYNYYHAGVGIRHYLISKKFNEGFCLKSSFGVGQGTEKTKFGNTNTHNFQNAFGYSVLGGFGYAIPLFKSKTALNLDLEYEYSNRNANVTGRSNTVKYINNQVSFNVGLIF